MSKVLGERAGDRRGRRPTAGWRRSRAHPRWRYLPGRATLTLAPCSTACPSSPATRPSRGSTGIVTLATFTCQPLEAVIGRRQENQWLGELQRGTGPLQNPLFLANVTMPLWSIVESKRCRGDRCPAPGPVSGRDHEPVPRTQPAQPRGDDGRAQCTDPSDGGAPA